VDITETAVEPTADESDPLGSFVAEEHTEGVGSVAGMGSVVPMVAEVPVIPTIPVPRVRATRRRLHRRPLPRFARLSDFVRWQWTKSQNWKSIRRLKTVRERREVSRRAMFFSTPFSMPFSIFAAGVVVGTLTASPGNRSNGGLEDRGAGPVGLEDRGAGPVGLEDRGADPVGLEDRGADPVGSARSTSPVAIGTALVSAPSSPVSAPAAARANPQAPPRSPGHRGTLIVTSQPVGASVYVNNRLAGRTPLVMNAVPAGSRAVRLSLDGYAAWSRGVSVVANQSTAITAKLESVR
jgi:hypothetical protein